MNFLALCQRARQECLGAGVSGPSAVTSQTGELLRIVDWVNQAWLEIQIARSNWRWMRSTFSVSTSSGDDSYAATDCTDTRLSATISRFAQWWPKDAEGYSNVKIYLSSAGVGTEQWLTFLEWHAFRTIYKIGTQNNGYPAHFTIDPQNNLVLGPKPDGTYVVSGEYQMSPQDLDENSDTPEMPSRFHLLIVYRAMQKYGANRLASHIYASGKEMGDAMMRTLEHDQLPKTLLAGPLT